MIDLTSLMIGAGSLLVWAFIRFVLVPRIKKHRPPRPQDYLATRNAGQRLSFNISIAILLLWIWIVGIITLSGGIGAGNNREFLIGGVVATVILMATALLADRRR